jgi:hypothetical protein
MLFFDSANRLTAFLIRQFRYGTGIDNANIRFLSRQSFSDSLLRQLFANGGSLGKIQFASERIIGCLLVLKNIFVYHCGICYKGSIF